MRVTTIPLGYAAIVELVCERIITDQYPEQERIPSVRDMAVQLEVNPVTITRAYDKLIKLGAVYSLPQVGYFVAPDAKEKIRELRLSRFCRERIPELHKELKLLGISHQELLDLLADQEHNDTEA